jgi:hypothetical protein
MFKVLKSTKKSNENWKYLLTVDKNMIRHFLCSSWKVDFKLKKCAKSVEIVQKVQ